MIYTNSDNVVVIENIRDKVFEFIDGSKCLDGTENFQGTGSYNNGVYTIEFKDEISNYPVLVENEMTKCCMSYLIEKCKLVRNATSLLSDCMIIVDAVDSRTVELTIIAEEKLWYIIEAIDTYSLLFIHWQWQTLRCKVLNTRTSEFCFNNKFKKRQFTLNMTDAKYLVSTMNNSINSAIQRIIDLEIINPNVDINTIPNNQYTYRNRKLLYRCEEEPKSVKIARRGTLLKIVNCSNVTIRNMVFKNNGVQDITLGGHTQAECDTGACVKIENSEGVVIEHCEFMHIFGYCVEVHGDVDRNIDSVKNKIQNNSIHDCFGGGIHLYQCNECSVSNNKIANYGTIQGGAVGILLRSPIQNCLVEKNTICYGLYSGISLGWRWGYVDTKPSAICKNNTIVKNHIHHCMKKRSNDGAGIYLLGTDEGNVIANNIIHDINSRNEEEGYGVYLDEGSSYVRCRNNIVIACDISLLIHYGYANEINNNIFAKSKKCALKYARQNGPSTLEQLAFFAYNNVFIIDSGMMSKTVENGVFMMTKNLFYINDVSNNNIVDKRFWDNYYVKGNGGKILGSDGVIDLISTEVHKTQNPIQLYVESGFPLFTTNNLYGLRVFEALSNPQACGASDIMDS